MNPGENVMRAALVSILKARREKLSAAARRRKTRPARWLYPWAQERHYAAAIRSWIRPVREYVENFLTTHAEAVLRGDGAAVRSDTTAGKTFTFMVRTLNVWIGKYVPEQPADAPYGEIFDSPVYIGLGNIADGAFDFNGAQYDKSAKHSLGIEFPTGEDWWKDARERWINQNYELIRGDLKKYIGNVNTLVEKAVTSGWSAGILKKEIKSMDEKLTRGRANFIARDQIGKLNGQITQARMESAGLTMYRWSTGLDERVRDSHRIMEDRLCRWDDPTTYSEDGGKTWLDRPADAVHLHPGADYRCRCCALAYWDELLDEADEQIDLLSQNEDNIPDTIYQGLAVMVSASVSIKNEMLKKQAETKEARRRQENAKKARDAAGQLFPDEKWKTAEEGIYLSPNRPVGEKSAYKDEKRDAQILRDLGSTIYLVPEQRHTTGKKYDAIVNGLKFEFKNVEGNANTLETQFLRSRSQAPNVFINLENSNLSRREIMSTLYGARNKPETKASHGYAHFNKFKDGRIILKIKGQKNRSFKSEVRKDRRKKRPPQESGSRKISGDDY